MLHSAAGKRDFKIAFEHGRVATAAYRIYGHTPHFFGVSVEKRKRRHCGNDGDGLAVKGQQISAIRKARDAHLLPVCLQHTRKEVALNAPITVERLCSEHGKHRKHPCRPKNERNGRALHDKAVSRFILRPEEGISRHEQAAERERHQKERRRYDKIRLQPCLAHRDERNHDSARSLHEIRRPNGKRKKRKYHRFRPAYPRRHDEVERITLQVRTLQR